MAFLPPHTFPYAQLQDWLLWEAFGCAAVGWGQEKLIWFLPAHAVFHVEVCTSQLKGGWESWWHPTDQNYAGAQTATPHDASACLGPSGPVEHWGGWWPLWLH